LFGCDGSGFGYDFSEWHYWNLVTIDYKQYDERKLCFYAERGPMRNFGYAERDDFQSGNAKFPDDANVLFGCNYFRVGHDIAERNFRNLVAVDGQQHDERKLCLYAECGPMRDFGYFECDDQSDGNA
jgi:hypothetical protein